MKLFIAEKPQLGTIIAQAIGIKNKHDGYYECQNNIFVTWCIGHILELAPPHTYNPNYKQWNEADLPLQIRPLKMQVKESTKKQFYIVESLLKKAASAVNAGDFDDEGQLLVDEVLNYVGFKGEVERILINDLNIESVKKALLHLTPNKQYQGMYKKALARSHADFLYGINLSRAYTITARKKGIKDIYSVGRVQTPTLGLIVQRYLLNKNHQSSFFYTTKGIFAFDKHKIIEGKLIITENISHDENRITDESVALTIKKSCENQESLIIQHEIKHQSKAPPLPFSLLDLQAKMNEQEGFSADKTLQITQTLREKYKAITYNRSDCRYLTSEQLKDAPKTIDFLKKTIDSINYEMINANQYSRAFNDEKVTAHTGIIPVSATFNIKELSKDELIVYQAIVKQYLIQFMPNKESDVCNIIFSCADYQFKTSATNITVMGWSNMLKDEDNSEEETTDFQTLSQLNIGDKAICQEINITKEKTKPLPLYTEATLLKDLQRIAKYVKDEKIKQLLIAKDADREGENGGIGTPATRSAIIKNLNEKGFFNYEGKKLIPTQKGIDFIQALPESITSPDITALWYEKQLDIEKGLLSVEAFLDDLDDFIQASISTAKNFNVELKGDICPVCKNGVMVLKKSKDNQHFYACSHYPECRNTKGTLDNTPIPDCPCCKKSSLKINSKAISCDCGLLIWRIIAEKNLTDKQLLSLLIKGKTSKINGFKSKAGKEFEAGLALDKDKKKVNFVF